MPEIMLIVNLVLLVAVLTLLILLLRKASNASSPLLASRLDAFEKAQERTERAVREEVAQSRDELGKAAREQRQELTEGFRVFGDSVVQRMTDVASLQKVQLDAFSGQLSSFAKASGERLDGVRAESALGAKQLREEVVATLGKISETLNTTMSGLASAQKGQLEVMSSAIEKLSDSNEKKLEAIRVTVQGELQTMQTDKPSSLIKCDRPWMRNFKALWKSVWANPSSKSANGWSRCIRDLGKCRRWPPV